MMGRRVAMVIDMNSCVGCMACTIACIRENIARQLSDVVEFPSKPLAHSRTKPILLSAKSGVPENIPAFIQCQHCENAPCAMVCPTHATYIDENGVVGLDHNKCIGCRACIIACPYGARTFYRGRLRGEPPNPKGFEPGYPDKCNFCAHRREKGGKAWTPACVEACAFDARVFGFTDEEPIRNLIRNGKAVTLLPGYGTRPKVYYIFPNKGR